MGSRPTQQVTFEIDKVIQPIYTGGDVVISADGQILATCVEEDALLTNPNTGKALCRIEGDGEIITALGLTPTASHIILCSRSCSMRIFSLDRQDERVEAILLRTLRPHTTPVVCATVDSTGTLLAVGGADSSIKVYDIQRGHMSHVFKGHSGIISALRFLEVSETGNSAQPQPINDKKRRKDEAEDDVIMLDAQTQTREATNASFRLASGGDDGKIRIWDLVKRKSIASLDSHVSVVRGLDFSSERQVLVSSSRDRTLIIWDSKSWKPKRIIPALEVLEDSIFIQQGKFICTGGEKGVVRVWDSNSGREITDEQEAGGDADAVIRLLNTKSSLISIHADQTLVIHQSDKLLSLGPNETISELSEIRRISGTHDEVIDLAFVTPERSLLALATNSEDIRLVSVEAGDDGDGGKYFGADVAALEGHEDIIISMDVDYSGCWLATGAKDNTARLWKIDHVNQAYTCYATFTGHAESIGAVALPSPTPQEGSAAYQNPLANPPIFLLTGSQDRTLKKWTVSTKSDQRTPKAAAAWTRVGHEKDINAIATNDTSTLFASASQDRTCKIWSIEEGEVQGVLRGHKRGIWSVQFAPRTVPSITGDDNNSSGKRGLILTGAGDKTVKLWSLSTYTCLRTLEGSTNSVLSVLWLPPRQKSGHNTQEDDEMTGFDDEEQPQAEKQDSVLIASAGADGLCRIYDAQTGEPATILDNHADRIWKIAAHPTNGTLVTGGADSVVTFWKDTTTETVTARAKEATQRTEQEQELANHVRNGNYREAIVLALTLNHPGRLLSLFTDVTKKSPPEEGSLSGLKAVDEVIATLSDDQLFKLLLRIRDWSTNARTAPVAQRILWVVVKSYPATRLVDLAKGKGRKGLGDVFAAIQAYTERHYRRMEELLEESYIVDFVVRGMGEEGYISTNGSAQKA